MQFNFGPFVMSSFGETLCHDYTVLEGNVGRVWQCAHLGSVDFEINNITS